MATRSCAPSTTPAPSTGAGSSPRSWAPSRPARSDEIARLGRTLRRWRAAILAYFDTAGASNGPTKAINGVIETMRRVARGFRNFYNYRLRALLAAGGHRPWR
uniref:transposase n=1 Tax=Kocuria carniphila TaxID=262208 RepID=UPI003908020D